ncbi:hypothetical protein Vafri_5618 [Volvox africanus]|uniref:Pro-Pol polyprotein n=1 Tax=Volvox africanus TaxID=51714 RepID=A0A8J4EX49_9CHLO|nr:hypothetical protein Vafri_5618 [Volvox africanus]
MRAYIPMSVNGSMEHGSTMAEGVAAEPALQVLAAATDVTYLTGILAILQVLAGQVKGVEHYSHPLPAEIKERGLATALATQSGQEYQVPSGVQEEGGERSKEIWEDKGVIYLLRHGVAPKGVPAMELKRCQRHARLYHMQGDVLYRVEMDGKMRVVPRPTDRVAIVQRMHEETGHFGVRRTMGLLLTSYWWRGMAEDVAMVIRHCVACDRINATFTAQAPTLNSLPVCGLFYRWGVDLCGPFNKTTRGYTYVMVCVEHFSCYIILVPLPDKHAEQTAFAFQHHVLGRYGACAEVCSDQGSEWKGEFAQLLVDCLIDHRQTSPSHPQANGLTERAVQTCKMALRRVALAGGGDDQWDKHLAYIMLGYNCSPQSSSKLAPYHIMHVVEPTIPPAIKERFNADLNLEDAEAAARSIVQRAVVLRRHMAIAGGNLLIAQHRDSLRYACLRGGAMLPCMRRFEIGDYVYYRNTSARTALDPEAKPEILRVVEVRPTGVLVLEGRCGSRLNAHVSHCAPCHLPIEDHIVDPRLARPSPNLACEVCKFPDAEEWMLLCDGCGTGWHTYCLKPPLTHIPEGTWVCPQCAISGVSKEQVQGRQPKGESSLTVPRHLKELEGAMVMRPGTGRGRRKTQQMGVANYAGRQGRSHRFQVVYDNGEVEMLGLMELRSRLASGLEERTAEKRVSAVSCKARMCWDLEDVETIHCTLEHGMPGGQSQEKAVVLHTAIQRAEWEEYEPTPNEVRGLVEVILLEKVSKVLLPFAWGGDGMHVLLDAGCSVRQMSGRSSVESMAPGRLLEEGVSPCSEAVVLGAPAEVLDLCLPSVVKQVGIMVAGCTSLEYVTGADEARVRWLRCMQEQGRLALRKVGRRLWVVVFATTIWKQALIRHAEGLFEVV